METDDGFCKFIPSRGKNVGIVCGKKCKKGSLCYPHTKLSEKQDLLQRKNQKTNERIETNEDIINHNKTVIEKYDLGLNKIQDNERLNMLLNILQRKINDDQIYFDRLSLEFDLILKFKFEKVFYQVYEILKLAGNIPHIIRGSAGSCLLCYLMGITNIDPIQENIELSRFMHSERKDIPDIDIDFPSKYRDLIYVKIFKRWENKVARISNHILYKEKSALREAIRMEGYHKFVPKQYDLNQIFKSQDEINKVKSNAKELIGNLRCNSLHCGGIVIFDEKVPENLLLKEYDMSHDIKGKQIWMDKDEVEDAGLIKIDVLSNRGLSQLWDISQTPIIEYTTESLDSKTLSIFKNGDNIGLTHSESRGMMKIFRLMQPSTLKEIAIALALIRPAASKNNQKAEFLTDYTPFKVDTNKYIIFDDDATLFIQKLLNCDISVADNYRRAFSKNKHKLKLKFIEEFDKIVKNETYKQNIILRLEQLEYYSFCKSHAFSYAQLVIALSYHKAHNPIKFWISTLNNCNSSYRKWVHYREATHAGLIIIPGKTPFTLTDDIIAVPTKYESQKYEKAIDQLLNYGYFVTKHFIPGMYYQEYWTHLNNYHKNLDKVIIELDKIKYARFKGLIVTSRSYKKENNRGFITFVTISSNDCVYHDLILYGYQKTSNMLTISGYGKVKYDGFVKWIDVIKWKSN